MDNLKLALDKLNLKKGDNLFLTTSLGMLGIPSDFKINETNKIFFKILKNQIGKKGSLFVPTYSYTFSSDNPKKIFDLKKTKAKIGDFPNFFLKQKGITRNIDPVVSIAGIGDVAKKILSQHSYSSYGKNCVFEKLIKLKNSKIVNIGLGTNWTPFIHYAEYLNNVEHRYEKILKGYIKKDKKIYNINWIYYSRALIDNTKAYAYSVGNKAYKKKIWKKTQLGRASIYACRFRDYFKFVNSILKKNKWIMAQGPKVNILKKERNKILYFNKNKVEDINQNLLFKKLIYYLNKNHDLTIKNYRTGNVFFNYLVPENKIRINNVNHRNYDEMYSAKNSFLKQRKILVFHNDNINSKNYSSYLYIYKILKKNLFFKNYNILLVKDFYGFLSCFNENFKNKIIVNINLFKNKKIYIKNLNSKLTKNIKKLLIKKKFIFDKKIEKNFIPDENYPIAKKKINQFKLKQIFINYKLNEKNLYLFNDILKNI